MEQNKNKNQNQNQDENSSDLGNSGDKTEVVWTWEGKNFSFFSHKTCEAFPCHQGVKEEDFNCLFCYCPLYALKDKCGGNYKYTDSGIKDCSDCTVPHRRKNYGYIIGKFKEIAEITRLDD